jgi:hypothetical protein
MHRYKAFFNKQCAVDCYVKQVFYFSVGYSNCGTDKMQQMVLEPVRCYSGHKVVVQRPRDQIWYREETRIL